jgi:hypothetical protein
MMTSDQIAQQHGHNFRAGYGGNAGLNSYESVTGFTPFGHGAGSQAGVSALSGMSSLANTSQLVGLGAMAGGFLLGKLGLGGSAVAAGLSRTAMLTGMTLPAALSLGVLTPAIAALGGAASGAQQYAQTQNVMDKAFGTRLGMGGAFGYGVSRQDALGLTESMRQLAAVPEMMTSMSELQQVLGKVSTMGIMQGMRDAKAFKQKFSELTGALRDMSKSLGTTLEETLPFLQSATRQGFLDVGQITSSVKRGAAMGSVGGGMARERMFQIQETGADIVRSLGGDSRLGSTGAQNMVGSLNMALSMGIITADDLMRTTGKTGEEGIEVLSKRYLAANANFMQNNRFFAAALAERDGQGMFTGKINETMLDRLQRGDISGAELMRAGQRSLSELTSEQALSFVNSMERGMGAEMGALAGPSGSARMITAVLEANGAKSKEAQRRLVQQMMNINQAEADMMLQIIERAGEVRERREQEVQQAMQRDRSAAYFKEHMTVKGLMHHLSTGARAIFVDPFMSSGAGYATRASNRFDELQARFIGSSLGGKLNMVLNPFSIIGSGADVLGLNPFMGNQRIYGMNQDATESELLSQMFTPAGSARATAEDVTVPQMMFAQGLSYEQATRMFGDASGLGYGSDRGTSIRKLISEGRRSSFNQGQVTRAASRVKEYLLSNGLSINDIAGMNIHEVSDLLAEVSTEGMTGVNTLIAASKNDELGGVDIALDNLAMSLEQKSSGVSSQSAAEAYDAIETMFSSPGFYDSMLGNGRFGKEQYAGTVFLKSDTLKDLMLGGKSSRAQLRDILEDTELMRQIALHKTNAGMLEKMIESNPKLKGLTVAQLKELGEGFSDLFSATKSRTGRDVEGNLAQLRKQVTSAASTLDRTESAQTALSRGQFLRSAFGGELGGKLAEMSGRGMAGYLEMQDTLQGVDETTLSDSARRIRKTFVQDYVGDGSDQEKVLERLGLTSAAHREALGLDNDLTITAEEKKRINVMKGALTALTPGVSRLNSRDGQLSAEMGITAKLLQETVEMRTKEIIAHTGMIRAIGEAAPMLSEAARARADEIAASQQGTGTRNLP